MSDAVSEVNRWLSEEKRGVDRRSEKGTAGAEKRNIFRHNLEVNSH
jgi:hypothetical protein